jgi:hypothetical protein
MILQDHIAYVVRREDFPDFTRYWESLGYTQLPALTTTSYPAQHIGFMRQGEGHSPMIASSVSDDPESPINKFLQLYGSHHVDGSGSIAPGSVQHIAYQIDTSVTTIEAVYGELVGQGVLFMTPGLAYEDGAGGRLKQLFCSCNVPWGPFVELVERTQLPVEIIDPTAGTRRQGFAAEQIDTLYGYYDEYSRDLLLNG